MNISQFYIGLAGVFGILAIGFYGLLASRNLIRVIISIQVLVKAALLGLIAAGSFSNKLNIAQSLALTVIVADTIVAVIGMAFAVKIRRILGSLDIGELSKLRG